MSIYAETSVLVALFHPRDRFSSVVNARVMKHSPDLFYPPWLRFELRHILQILKDKPYGETAWAAMVAGEGSRLMGLKEEWLAVIQKATDLSARHAKTHPCGSLDVLHIASALTFSATEFWTCDAGQAGFAKAAGLKVILFKAEDSVL